MNNSHFTPCERRPLFDVDPDESLYPRQERLKVVYICLAS